MWNADLVPRPMFLEEFAPMVGQTLVADCNPQPVEIQLVSARALDEKFRLDRLPFVLLFRTPPEVLLLTGIYAMKCGEWGPDLIYIEQTYAPDPKDKGHFYQAVFN